MQKSGPKTSEEAQLVKMFKFFDVLDRGAITLLQFMQVLGKIGFQYPKDQIEPLFNQYDADQSGFLDYKESAVIVFGSEAAAKGAVSRQPVVSAQTAEQLVQAFRAKLLLRGARSLIGISRIFKIADDDGSQSLNFPEFHKAVKESKLEISVDDCKNLFAAFDADRSGSINYDEFLGTVKGPMSESRQNLVRKAFALLDKDGSGDLDFTDICGVYNVKNNPAVIEGRKTEEQALNDFLATFEVSS